MVIRGRLVEGIDWEFGIDMYTLLYLKQIINKDLLQETILSSFNNLQGKTI